MDHRLTDPEQLDEPTSPAELAERAWLQTGADPERAERLAAQALAQSDDPGVRSVALRARGFAALELRDVASALDDLLAAVDLAGETGDAGLLAEAEAMHALALQYDGQGSSALLRARAAAARSPERPRPALVVALILDRLGHDGPALEAYARAEQLAIDQGDIQVLARLRCNRGVLQIYRADLDAAQADLSSAQELCEQSAITRLGVLVSANLGFLAAQRGDLVTALDHLGAVSDAMAASGPLRSGVHQLDRCEVLLAAGLPHDAAGAGLQAVSALEEAGLDLEAAEARVVAAQAAVAAGDLETAARLARGALPQLAAQGRRAWVGLAREVLLHVARAAAAADEPLLIEARAVAKLLTQAGWRARAARARILEVEIACELGDLNAGRAAADTLANETLAEPTTAIGARHAAALLCRATGELDRAQIELLAGWELFVAHRATLGATELRAGALTHAAELAQLGVELAEQAAEPAELLAWAERRRSGLLANPPTHAPDDAELAGLLGKLRRAAADLEAAIKDQTETGTLRTRRLRLEDQVRQRAQLVRGDPAVEGWPLASSSELGEALGEARVLVLYEIVGPNLHALTIGAPGTVNAVSLGPLGAAVADVAALRHALARLADPALPGPLRVASRTLVDALAQSLSAQLLAPLPSQVAGAAELVIVPTGELHALPWSLLAPDRPITLAPSGSLWLRAARRPRPTDAGGLLLAAGPGLEHAEREIGEVAALRRAAAPIVLAREAATAATVLRAASGCDTVHLACHGQYRADNPAFSTLRFSDGPLGAFELERLRPAPALIILSACDAALAGAAVGDELVGLSANLLRAGTAAVIASVLPVPDAAARELVAALHAGLQRGEAPAMALHHARQTAATDEQRVAAAGFQLLGAG